MPITGLCCKVTNKLLIFQLYITYFKLINYNRLSFSYKVIIFVISVFFQYTAYAFRIRHLLARL